MPNRSLANCEMAKTRMVQVPSRLASNGGLPDSTHPSDGDRERDTGFNGSTYRSEAPEHPARQGPTDDPWPPRQDMMRRAPPIDFRSRRVWLSLVFPVVAYFLFDPIAMRALRPSRTAPPRQCVSHCLPGRTDWHVHARKARHDPVVSRLPTDRAGLLPRQHAWI